VVVDEQNKILFVCVYQMPVMLIRIHGIIIMIYMIFWGYHIRNKQTKKFGSGTFAVCKNHGTRQRCQSLPCAKTMAHGKDLNFAVCHVCRHTAKIWPRHRFWLATLFCRGSRVAHGKPFAVCRTRQSAHGNQASAKPAFAVCYISGTRPRVCRVPLSTHGKIK